MLATFSWAQIDWVLATSAKEVDAQITETGRVYRSLKDDAGNNPVTKDRVKVHGKVRFLDGKDLTALTTSASQPSS